MYTEFQYAVRKAPIVVRYVVDFNFDHVIQFIDQLSDKDITKFPKVTCNEPSQRLLSVELQITESCPKHPQGVRDCMNRSLNLAKRGHTINVQYKAHREHLLNSWDVNSLPSLAICRSSLLDLNAHRHEPSRVKPSRRQLEMAKVVAVLEKTPVDAEATSYITTQ